MKETHIGFREWQTIISRYLSTGLTSRFPEITKMIKDLFAALFPPDVPAVTRWRLMMAFVVSLCFTHALWAVGALAFAGAGSGYTLAARSEEIINDIKSIRRSLLERDIIEARENECRAKDRESRRYFQGRISSLLTEYALLSRVPVQMFECGGEQS